MAEIYETPLKTSHPAAITEPAASTKKGGFASMDPAKRREICARGGRAAHANGTAHKYSSEEARLAGRKGGIALSANREHMREIGRKGGKAASADRGHMARIGRKGGVVASSDRERMSEIGRLGGLARSRGEVSP